MAFDPYESWLGVTSVHRPPTYYDLLGLSPFESDPEIIEQAALRRMSKVRQHQIGPHSDESQEILAELARARLVLIDSDRRGDYDAQLRGRVESRPDLRAVMEKKNVILDAASGVAAPVEDGLDILAKLRTGDDSRPDCSVAVEINLTGDATPSVAAPGAGGLDVLASIAKHGSEGSLSVRSTKKKSRGVWKNRLFVVGFLTTHAALIGVFVVFGSAIALYVRSFFGGNDPPAQAAAQNPKSPDGRPASTDPGQNPIVDNRPAPTTWLNFKRGTRITVVKSDDFDMADHDFTIYARIKTGNSGTLFSKAPAAGGWVPGAKRLFIHNGRLAFQICGGSVVTGRQVNDELWHEVAVTYACQNRQLCLVVDGKSHRPTTVEHQRDVTGHVIRIGSAATNVAASENEHFAGLISEVRFYQRALTAAEIAGLPSQEPIGKLPLAQWRLREGGGRSIRDQTEHGHVGTLEDGAVSNAAVLAAKDTRTAHVSAPYVPENGRPPNENPLPDGEDRGGREVTGNEAQDQVKDDDSPEGILKQHGLKAKGELYVPATEHDVKRKVTESLHLAGKLQFHLMQKQAAMNAELRPAMIERLEFRIADCQAAIQLTNQNITAIPKHRGQFWNIQAEELFNQLTVYKSGLEEELRQADRFLRDLKSPRAIPQWNQRNEELAKADQKSYDKTLREARELVNASNRKIHELTKNEQIMKALAACGKNAKKPLKLGWSPEFAKNVAELEKLESEGWRGWKRGG
jgi:hypothetical protein